MRLFPRNECISYKRFSILSIDDCQTKIKEIAREEHKFIVNILNTGAYRSAILSNLISSGEVSGEQGRTTILESMESLIRRRYVEKQKVLSL